MSEPINEATCVQENMMMVTLFPFLATFCDPLFSLLCFVPFIVFLACLTFLMLQIQGTKAGPLGHALGFGQRVKAGIRPKGGIKAS